MAFKVLFCATVDYHFKAFHLPLLKWCKEQGFEVHVAANGNIKLPYVDKQYVIPIQRSPFSLLNMEAYKQLKAVVRHNDYAIVHCHTPLGGLLARLAARKARKNGTKVIYTAHGFHFCKGAPIVNWLVYYPIEKYFAHMTDCLITINQEDYKRAIDKKFRTRRIEQIRGVGVNTERFKPVNNLEKFKLRQTYGYETDDLLLFYAAEFNQNKNQQFLLHVIAGMKKKFPNLKLLLAGEGALLESCRQLAESLGILETVHFLGFRKDIDKLLLMSDIAVSSSKREGLPVNVMEAMACGLPVVAVANRGIQDLIENDVTGIVMQEWDRKAFSESLLDLAENPEKRCRLGQNGRKKMTAAYNVTNVLEETARIYQSVISEQEVAAWQIP